MKTTTDVILGVMSASFFVHIGFFNLQGVLSSGGFVLDSFYLQVDPDTPFGGGWGGGAAIICGQMPPISSNGTFGGCGRGPPSPLATMF